MKYINISLNISKYIKHTINISNISNISNSEKMLCGHNFLFRPKPAGGGKMKRPISPNSHKIKSGTFPGRSGSKS